MSHRLQVLIPEDLDARIDKAAQRNRVSKGEWVRRAIELSLRPESSEVADPFRQLSSLNAPTGDIDQMIEEIESGRR
jgi:hypothetical protein